MKAREILKPFELLVLATIVSSLLAGCAPMTTGAPAGSSPVVNVRGTVTAPKGRSSKGYRCSFNAKIPLSSLATALAPVTAPAPAPSGTGAVAARPINLASPPAPAPSPAK